VTPARVEKIAAKIEGEYSEKDAECRGGEKVVLEQI
jgi:hypothetical protein